MNKEIALDQKVRKENSELILKKNAIEVFTKIPFTDSEENVTIKDIKKIKEYVTILAFTNLVSFNDIPENLAISELKKYELWDIMGAKEKFFLENPTEELKNNETWKSEAIWILMWTLNIVDEIGFPNELANLKAISYEVYPIGANKDPNDFINSERILRGKKEILDALDLYYRMDQVCIDAHNKGVEQTMMHSRVVYERYTALKWLTNTENSI